jgi:hypothetical protein
MVLLVSLVPSNQDSNTSKKSYEELIAKFLESEKQLQEAKKKTKAVKKLRQTVDELANEVGVNK